jgi:metalloendopeptidase OMA1, mitochondrial
MRILVGLCLSIVVSFGNRGELVAQEKSSTVLGEFTQADPVTGLATINRYSLKDEIEAGRTLETVLLDREKAEGFSIDADATAMTRIERILKPLAAASHLPTIPWRFHFTSNPRWNAFANMGGVVLVLKGLFDDVSDIELAGVLAHEVAHITCRHQCERLTHEQITSLVSDAAKSIYYKSSYSTENEAEADRVGLLYMALAGYDPQQVHKLWERIHRRSGSNPGDYTFTHPLNKDRAEMTRRWGVIAAKYYEGEGKQNSQLGEVLINNELAPRMGSTGNETIDFLSAALLERLKYRKTKEEAERREEAAEAAKQRRLVALKLMKINRVYVGKSLKGKPGVFTLVQNGSNTLMKQVEVQFYYKTIKGDWAPYQRTSLQDLRAGEERSWGLEFEKPEQSRWEFKAAVIDVDF